MRWSGFLFKLSINIVLATNFLERNVMKKVHTFSRLNSPGLEVVGRIMEVEVVLLAGMPRFHLESRYAITLYAVAFNMRFLNGDSLVAWFPRPNLHNNV